MNALKPILATDRIKTILDYWFTPSWDRNSKLPETLYSSWFGIGYDVEKQRMVSLKKEEQEKIDQYIRDQFLGDLKLSTIKDEGGYFNSWKVDKQGKLALIILQDQMARNMFRKQAEAFAYEPYALEIVLDMLKEREDKGYTLCERMLIYLPLEHSENIAHQDTCYNLFEELSMEYSDQPELKKMADSYLGYSEKHRAVIRRFGRFPHRNEVLGRISTEEEINYLNEGGNRFGQ